MKSKDILKNEPLRAFLQTFKGTAALLFLISIVTAIISLVTPSRVIIGTVVDFETIQNSIPFVSEDSGLMYYPIIQYEENSVFEAHISRVPSRERYAIGDPVELRITEGGSVYINSVWGRWGLPIVFAGISLIFAACAFALANIGKGRTART